MTSEEFRGTAAQTQGEVDQDGKGKADSGTTSDQDDTRVLDPISPGDRAEGTFNECAEDDATFWGVSSLGGFFAITVVFFPGGESNNVIPECPGPSSLCTDEEDEEASGGVRRLLITDGADGERMGGELVDRGDGEDEVLSWSPWSTFWGENGETDELSGHRFGESVSGGRDVRVRWVQERFNSGGDTRNLSQQGGVVLGFVVHFESGKGRLPGVGESLFARRSIGHLSLENTVDPEPEGGAPNSFSDPDDQGAPAPPADGGMMHSGGPQSDGDKEDVEGVESLVEVVAEETEGGCHQDGEWSESSPTPNEWWVIPGIDVGGPTSYRVLGRGKLDTPSQDVEDGDEIDKAANPTMSGGQFIEGELGGVWKGEDGEGSSLERKEDTEGEEGEGDVSGSASHGPPRFGNLVVGDVSIDLFLGERWVIWLVRGRGGNAGGFRVGEIVGADKTEDHAEDKEEYETKKLRVGWQGEWLLVTFPLRLGFLLSCIFPPSSPPDSPPIPIGVEIGPVVTDQMGQRAD